MTTNQNSTTFAPKVEIRLAAQRHSTTLPWLESRNSFDTGVRPAGPDTHHGVLVVSNDDTVAPGTGFDTHPHRDIDIVTWVLQGSLVHQDSTGHSGLIYPGLAQRMTAGTGILHSEKNDSWRNGTTAEHSVPVRFIQMWVVPDTASVSPSYEQLELSPDRLAGALIPVASGMARHADDTAIRIANRHAALHASRLSPSESVDLPEAPFLHMFVARGRVDLEGHATLNTGDTARLTMTGGQRVTALEPAEILVWEMHASLN